MHTMLKHSQEVLKNQCFSDLVVEPLFCNFYCFQYTSQIFSIYSQFFPFRFVLLSFIALPQILSYIVRNYSNRSLVLRPCQTFIIELFAEILPLQIFDRVLTVSLALALNSYSYIYIYDSQIVHHNPCFNLFILHSNPFDNQGSEINKNDIFLRFDILSFTNILKSYFSP